MAKHVRGSAGNPPPDDFEPDDEDAFAELEEDYPDTADAIKKFHGDFEQLTTAIESTTSHLPDVERDEVNRLVWDSMGVIPPGETPPADE